MTKQELDKLIEAAKICLSKETHQTTCASCPMVNVNHLLCNTTNTDIKELIFPILKDYRQLKYGEPKTNDEQLKQLIDDIKSEHAIVRLNDVLPYLEWCERHMKPSEAVKAKEEIDTTKELTKGQTIDFLIKNPSWSSKSVDGRHIKRIDEDSVEIVIPRYEFDLKWQLIPPEPVEVEFKEAFKAYNNCKTIQSIITENEYQIEQNSILRRDLAYATDEEIDGAWIILSGEV